MKKKLTKEQLIRILLIVSILSVTVIGIYFLGKISSGFFGVISQAAKSVIIPFSIAFLLSYLIAPLADFFEKKLKIKRSISIIFAIVIGMIFVLGLLSITLTFIITQLITVIVKLVDILDNETMRSFFDTIMQLIEKSIDFNNLISVVAEFEEYGLTTEVILNGFGTVFSSIKSGASALISIGFTFILTPVFLYYMVKDRLVIFDGILHVFPEKSQEHLKNLAIGSNKVIKGYFVGQGMIIIFITIFFTLSYVILSFFIPGFSILHALLFALIMGLFSIFPYIGVWISMAMPIMLFLTLHFEATDPGLVYIIGIIMVLVLNIIEQLLESTIIQPKAFSKQVQIHPLAVLSSFLFFGAVFGLVGLILAVPIAGTIKVVAKYFKELNQKKKHKPKKELN
ncbi:MAG: AI-2E family transporter [Candidatus Izemoplasmatales bacterium]|nr:AI-2E family transporter [Candidatus Izemoplasmatales bacterium]